MGVGGMDDQVRKSRWAISGRAILGVTLILVICAVAAPLFDFRCGAFHPYVPPPLAASGNAANLRATIILPCADLPMPVGKNVIWSASFQVAWDELKKVAGGGLPGNQDLVRRLNAVVLARDTLPRDNCYVATGPASQSFIDKINADMNARFPGVKPDIVPANADDVLAYAYLKAEVKFAHPFFDSKSGLDFVDATGVRSPINSFGLYQTSGSSQANDQLAEQVAVLYRVRGDEFGDSREFALDLDRHSAPAQLILARVEPRETLAATWKSIKEKIADPLNRQDAYFGSQDRLGVPNINFDLLRRYTELETDNDFHLLQAAQRIKFRLDRAGADLADESTALTRAAHRRFLFDRPFLVVLRNRDSGEPYFLMWIANAELLCAK